MKTRVHGTLATLALALFVSSAVAAADITVQQPWARASAAPGGAGAAFMVIDNGGAADRLVKAASPVAEVTELHTHIDEGGVMKMRAVAAIDVPGKAETRLAPGGLHVMLIGLKAPLKEGETIAVTLTFEKAGSMTVAVPVLAPTAMGPAAASGGSAGKAGGHGGGH
jgi:copper(I)-binding protein